jgi:methyl-accepting chemotaxis protein
MITELAIGKGNLKVKTAHSSSKETSSLRGEIRRLAEEFQAGSFGGRGNVDGLDACDRESIEDLNAILDSIVPPLRFTAENTGTLASAAEELTAVGKTMAASAGETAMLADFLLTASEQISTNVGSVATATEQMQAAIREISKNANDSAREVRNAVNIAESANERIKKLETSSREIDKVIKVIKSIAKQTNLLALNATIEAARAGEAGKGFAVVANEVKELAKQTRSSTEEIGRTIETLQAGTKGAAAAFTQIEAIIGSINDISSSIASAVEEQTVTTNEIGHNINEAAQGINEVTGNLHGVAVSAKQTTQGAEDTMKASLELSRLASGLQTSLEGKSF